MGHRNLFILHDTRVQPDRDFRRIAARVRSLAPEIHAFVITERKASRWPRLAQLLRPSLFAEIHPVPGLRIWRGHHARSRTQGKIESYRTLDAAGLPLAPWQEITPGLRLNPETWGPYVVVKPAKGSRGDKVAAAKTERVRYRPPDYYPEDHPGRRGPMIAQRFVYTGPYPSAYRVLTCFGEPLFAQRWEAAHRGPPLSGPVGFAEGMRTIVASARGATAAMVDDADLLALARRIHEALPDTPLIGSDIMRDAATGELWIAEANTTSVWTLNAEAGIRVQGLTGIDLYGQFGAIDRAAESMIRAVRRFAR